MDSRSPPVLFRLKAIQKPKPEVPGGREVGFDKRQRIPDLWTEIGIAPSFEIECRLLLGASIGQLVHEVQKTRLGDDPTFHGFGVPMEAEWHPAANPTEGRKAECDQKLLVYCPLDVARSRGG